VSKRKKGKGREMKKDAKATRRSSLRENLDAILVAVLFALFVRTYMVQAFQIPTSSMEDDLLIGDHLLVNKFMMGPSTPFERSFLPMREVGRFDVVIFNYPEDPVQDFVKRVVGLPGDTIEVVNHRLYVNGRLVPEDSTRTGRTYRAYHKAPAVTPELRRYELRYGPTVVPPGHYFVMGDNRDFSADSREWGPVPADQIKGRPLFIYWSYEAERESHVFRGWRHKIGQILDRIIHFIPKTRWSRTFRPVR
jgi:signal peptidase I